MFRCNNGYKRITIQIHNNVDVQLHQQYRRTQLQDPDEDIWIRIQNKSVI